MIYQLIHVGAIKCYKRRSALEEVPCLLELQGDGDGPNSSSAPDKNDPICSSASTAGIRSWTGPTKAFGSVVIIEKHSPRSLSSSQIPAIQVHSPPGSSNRSGTFPFGPSIHS